MMGWQLWLMVAVYVVMLLSFGWWCWLWFAADDEQPIRELDGIEEM